MRCVNGDYLKVMILQVIRVGLQEELKKYKLQGREIIYTMVDTTFTTDRLLREVEAKEIMRKLSVDG